MSIDTTIEKHFESVELKNQSDILLLMISEIQKAIENECFLAALALALTIPDICGKAEYPNASGSKDRYVKWYDEHVGKYECCGENDDMPYPSGEIIYSLRCCMLHQGNPSIESDRIHNENCRLDRFKLTINDAFDGGNSSISYTGNPQTSHKYLEINILNLCKKLCLTAKSYYNDNKDKFDFFEYEIIDKRKVSEL